MFVRQRNHEQSWDLFLIVMDGVAPRSVGSCGTK